MLKSKLVAIFAISMMSFGCATIMSGSKQTITVKSNVQDAEISIINLEKKETDKDREILVGKTPFIGEVPRLSKGKLVVKKSGYKTVEVEMKTQTNMVFLGNILTGGTTGTSTDFSSGAIRKYAPNEFLANLEPLSTLELENFKKESALRVFAVMNFDRIGSDISAGKGEYLEALYSLMKITSAKDKETALIYIKESYTNSDSIPDFAQALVIKL